MSFCLYYGSFRHQDKILVRVNILGNNTLSDSDSSMKDWPWNTGCSELSLRGCRCPYGCARWSCFPGSPRPSPPTLCATALPPGLSKGSWSLLKPRITSMLWTRVPTTAPPALTMSWKLLGERQLSSTMFMVSSDKCIRMLGWDRPTDKSTWSYGGIQYGQVLPCWTHQKETKINKCTKGISGQFLH